MKYMCIIDLPELTRNKIYEGKLEQCNMIKVTDDFGLTRYIHSCLFKYIEGDEEYR